ncbi:ABC transporter ATP-binding protein [Aestuariivirga litoralis]|uniref:ABC transporter ATP-binding protein n=1 Tax=Aestuariivirga litoralis TaxID=2650924 RepID=UPI0018C543B6|nr:ABC transporter ATP-binding protein [Aestuariivirga litoralis]MBG1233891.1 ABC transporter ATP-binding protein [Aestuariivirga litoralis]
MAEIILRDIEKYFGDVYVIRKLNLTIKNKEFVVLLGPSGCGKTTTLRAIAGLEDINTGEILIDGKPVQSLEPGNRDIAFVFQLFALYPHLTAHDNIAFPLRATNEATEDVNAKVKAVAKSLQIEHLMNKRPSQLSGGDMQRVAIGRALVRRPKAMLMDEPIGALDAKLREEMRVELKRLHVENQSTTVYVTHDQVEAMALADRVAIMNDGVLQQVGTPDEVYNHPANLFVAQFVGSPVMNIAPGKISSAKGKSTVALAGAKASFDIPAQFAAQITKAGGALDKVMLGIRPEGVLLSDKQEKAGLLATVKLIEPLGSHDIVDLGFGDQTLRARTSSGRLRKVGDKIWARLDPDQIRFFDQGSSKSFQVKFNGAA